MHQNLWIEIRWHYTQAIWRRNMVMIGWITILLSHNIRTLQAITITLKNELNYVNI